MGWKGEKSVFPKNKLFLFPNSAKATCTLAISLTLPKGWTRRTVTVDPICTDDNNLNVNLWFCLPDLGRTLKLVNRPNTTENGVGVGVGVEASPQTCAWSLGGFLHTLHYKEHMKTQGSERKPSQSSKFYFKAQHTPAARLSVSLMILSSHENDLI